MADPTPPSNPKGRADPFKKYKPLEAVFQRNPFALLGPPIQAAGNFAGDVIVEALTGEPRHEGEPSKFPPAVKKVAEDAAVLAVPGPGVKIGTIVFDGNVPFTHKQGQREGLGSGEEQKLAQEQAELQKKLQTSRDQLLNQRDAANATTISTGTTTINVPKAGGGFRAIEMQIGGDRRVFPLERSTPAVLAGQVVREVILAGTGTDVTGTVFVANPVRGLKDQTVFLPLPAKFVEITNDAPSLMARSNAEEGAGGGVPGLLVTADP